MRKGFTVPEILAVVAIIMIILSILLPAFSNTRIQAYQAICASNNRQLVQAALNYTLDHSRWLPFTNWGSQEGTWAGKGWLYQRSLGAAEGNQKNGQLWPYHFQIEIYRCPQDKRPYIAGTTHQITSYLLNGAFSGYGDNAPDIVYKNHRFASNAIMFWEVDSLSGPGYYNDGSSYPHEAVTKRHLSGLTVGSRDGHTEWMTYAEYGTEQAKKPGRLWCKPDSATGQ